MLLLDGKFRQQHLKRANLPKDKDAKPRVYCFPNNDSRATKFQTDGQASTKMRPPNHTVKKRGIQ